MSYQIIMYTYVAKGIMPCLCHAAVKTRVGKPIYLGK